MIKRFINKEDWREIEPAFVRGGIQYYYLRVDKQEQEDGNIICIEDIIDHIPTDEDKTELYAAYLNLCKKVAKANISAYAASENVAQFEVKGHKDWFSDTTRNSIKASVTCEKNAGRSTTKIYIGGTEIEMACDDALTLIDRLELYAKDCFVVTEQHKTTVEDMSVIEDVEQYDYTQGYPAKVVIE